jgi:hypothetical protein
MSAPTYMITLRAERDDSVRGLRALLKRALRSYGLRAIDVREETNAARRGGADHARRERANQ